MEWEKNKNQPFKSLFSKRIIENRRKFLSLYNPHMHENFITKKHMRLSSESGDGEFEI